jgi:GTPase SAR1 family protein
MSLSKDAVELLHGFLLRLRSGYQRSHNDLGGEIGGPVFSLDLAISALKDLMEHSPVPLHITVLGPTQVGKSTIVNLLLGEEAAQTSPLAGFTRTLQGFTVNTSDTQRRKVETFFSRTAKELVSLRTVDNSISALTNTGYTVWDTPDFDSYSSREYRTLITQVTALSDLIILVVSKEKYSDWTVWKVLDLLFPLHRPLLICLNKASQDLQQLRLALQGRVDESRYHAQRVPICDLPYVDDGSLDRLLDIPATESFLNAVHKTLRPIDATVRRRGANALVSEHWEAWLQPVRIEHDAAARWRKTVDDAVSDAVDSYQKQYLEHSRHDSTFNRAMVQLLELLEIPVLARPLATTRQLLTWPFRKLFASKTKSGNSRIDVELEVLSEIFEHLLLFLRRTIGDGVGTEGHHANWWRAMAKLFDERSSATRKGFIDAVGNYQRDFESEIEVTARTLYDKLAQSPATLNSLRTARVTADAAGVALAFKTGAIGVNELVLTPAMLSLTSFLTESAVGTYMNSIKAELRARQQQQVNILITRFCDHTFSGLPGQLRDDRLFSVEHEELERVEQLRQTL